MVSTLLLGYSLAAVQVLPFSDVRGQRLPEDEVSRYPHFDPEVGGSWQVIWDDLVDGDLKSASKNCDMVLRVDDRTVTGVMSRLPGDEGRKAAIMGRIDPVAEGGRGLLTFQQVEGDYVCSYQVFFGMSGAIGQWMDNRGRSGDFALMKYQQIRTTETGGR